MADGFSDSWWQQNDPSQQSLADTVASLYQQYLGRAPESNAVVQNWISGTNGNLNAIAAGIQGSPEAQTYAQQQAQAPAPVSAAATPAASTPTDPNAYLQQLLAQGTDPNSAVNQTNQQFNLPIGQSYQYNAAGSRGAGSNAFIGVPGGGYLAEPPGGGPWNYNAGDSAGGSSGGGYLPAPLGGYTPPPAPAQMAVPQPLSLPQMAMPAPITLPTAAQVQATPGYQFTLDQGLLGINRAAGPQGTGSGAEQQAAAQYATGLADQYYQQAVGNQLAVANANVQLPLAVQQANAGNALNAYTASNNAALGANYYNLAGLGQQFNQTFQPYTFGANYGLNLANLGLAAQNQFFGQGLAQNENAFNQYNTNQNAAFNQWLALAQLGYIGNPYS